MLRQFIGVQPNAQQTGIATVPTTQDPALQLRPDTVPDSSLYTESGASTTEGDTAAGALPRRRLGVLGREMSTRVITDVAPASRSLLATDDAGETAVSASIATAPSSTSPLRDPSEPATERQHSIGDGSLNEMLERLEAAEWHVRHRQESLGRASLSDLIAQSGRRSSGVPSTRRASTESSTSAATASTASPPQLLARSHMIAELTELVDDAERRKTRHGTHNWQSVDTADSTAWPLRQHRGSQTLAKHQQKVTITTTKKKGKRAHSSTRHSSRVPGAATSSSTSLSALLRDELHVVPTRQSARGLVDRVAKVEAKRKTVRFRSATVS